MILSHLVTIAALTLAAAPLLEADLAVAAMQRADRATAQEVQRALARVRDLRRVTVSVSEGEVTLSGEVSTLWLKREAARRAADVDGVDTVISTLEVPRAANDARLAQQVGRAIDQYPQLDVFDYVTGTVREGVVTLIGSVTPEGRKASDVEDAVARVRGVQEIRNEIVTLPPSLEDDRIRASIATRLRAHDHLRPLTFGRPSFHIVVHNSVVSLYGVVPGEVEYRQFESLARETLGVLRVHNHLQTPARSR